MKRTLLFGLMLWLIIFVEVSTIGFTPGLATTGDNGFTLLPIGVGIHFVILVGLAILAVRFYFKKGANVLKDPLTAAVIMISVGMLLDAAVTVPLFVKDFGHYYSKWTLWVGAAIFVIVFTILGRRKISGRP